MNEQVRELWKQCVMKHSSVNMNWQNVADDFAELIIKECAEVASNYNGAHYVGTAIEEHFGVEK